MTGNFSDCEAVIIANGELRDYRDIIDFADKFTVAADGAYFKCLGYGIRPNLVIGDMDSSAGSREGTEFLKIEDQDTTDLEKAILYCLDKNIKNILILGAFGEELDHSLNNFILVSKYSSPEVKFTIIDGYSESGIKIGFFLSEGETKILGRAENSTLSILPAPEAVISTRGLKWESSEYKIRFGAPTGARNICLREKVTIDCLEGKCLVILDVGLNYFR